MSPRSFIDLLENQAKTYPDLPVLRFLEDGELDGAVSIATFARLRRRAHSIAAALKACTAAGDRVLLVFPPGIDFVEALFGAFYAGVVAVPAYAPDPARLERSLARLGNIVADCAPTLALTSTPFLGLAQSLTEGRMALPWLATDAVPEADVSPHPADTNDVAFLQYTSGSTGDPRGVRITHGNLLTNSARIREFFGQGPESRGVMWMPPYHDMGLVGGILQPIFSAYEMTLLSPMHVLQRPERWLLAMSALRATTSGGPNFGYELALRAFAKGGRDQLDLSSWIVALNGAEPVRADTLERFAAFFASCGFRKEALSPCYGLAESTLVVTASAPLAGMKTFAVDTRELRDGRVVETAALDRAQRLVGCGRPADDTELA
ncbi:MAG TPA: AMP-binding protein, partial [Labilithrix sp.]|nr:AMP-binding protein [Labilithrix sp.]